MKKVKKTVTKKMVAMTINKKVWNEFTEYCTTGCISKSALVEKLISDYLKNR